MKTFSIYPSCNLSTKRPKVSVVIPIYNKADYLYKSINSIATQTLNDIEIICVNDGSKDASQAILEDFARKDKRLCIISQANQGTGCARNNGLKICSGEYVSFVDPDDWLEKDALENLYNRAKELECDMLVFNRKHINSKGEIVKPSNIGEKLKECFEVSENKTFKWQDIRSKIFGGLSFASTNKIYKTDFIHRNRIHFAKSSFAEDSPFVIEATLRASSIGYTNQDYYNYLVHENSAMRQISDKNFCIFRSFDAIRNVLERCGLRTELSQNFDDYIVYRVITDLKRVCSKDKFLKICSQRLSSEQCKLIEDYKLKGIKLLTLLDGLKIKL